MFQQFAFAATLVLTITMVALGSWINKRIADGVLQRSAEAGALYMESILEPHVQTLANGGTLTSNDIAMLDEISANFALRQHVMSLKVWLPDGTVAYSSQKELIGRKFSIKEIQPALGGEINGYLSELDADENTFERTLSIPLYEIYAPLYRSGTSEIIAVGEFYENAEQLSNELFSAVADNWLVVGGSAIGMLLILFAIVFRGSALIERQRTALKLRFRQQIRLHRTNERLQANMQEALRETARIDHRIQRRLGAEIHDGPAQLISFVLLRLDEIDAGLTGGPAGRSTAREVLSQVRRAAADALADLRSISTGLFLPVVDSSDNLTEIVGAIVAAHERRTGAFVSFHSSDVPAHAPSDVAQCVGRVTQEALNNAFKYAEGAEQQVSMTYADGILHLSIWDAGPGMRPSFSPTADGEDHLGLQSIKYRVESLGGTVEFRPRDGVGMEVACVIPFGKLGRDD
ncbi:MAG: sensor histidine kinase [Allorhizobium sp.]